MSTYPSPQWPDPGAGQPGAATPRSSGIVKWLVIGAIVVGLIMAAMLGTCVLLIAQAPDTKVLGGRQIPKRYVEQIQSLGILDPDEQIDYFYSDAMFNIEDGFYLLADRRVVIYSRTFDEPAILVLYEEIEEVDGEFSDDWMQDSYILLTLKDGTGLSFPASPGGRRRPARLRCTKKAIRASRRAIGSPAR
jgi:hypothetical protein